MVKRFLIGMLVQLAVLNAAAVSDQKKNSTPSWAEEIEIVTKRLAANYLEEEIDGAKIKGIVAALKTDGSWPGIDYTTVGEGFPAERHLKNLRMMAVCYARPGTDFYRSEALKRKILLGYTYYLDKDPRSKNWWYNEIGAPQDYLVGFVLMKAEIPERDLRSYSSYIRDLTDNPGHRGMNRIWVSAITIAKGCLEEDALMVSKGFQSVASTLIVAHEQGVEGIKIDNSFHQHRPQLYSGGYGMGFAEGVASLMALSANTAFSNAFSEEKMNMFSSMMLEGHQQFSYRRAVDFGTIGRNISRPGAVTSINPAALDQMAVIHPAQAPAFRSWKLHLQGADFPAPYQGNRYFWKSDIMTQHGPDYYLSAKVISTRTNGTEMLNGENLKGYNLPLGATNIMKTGEEYKDIFPIWDWTRIPGTTAVMNESAAILPWYLFGNNEFAGGVSDRQAGAIAYEHSYNGVQAKKAYFFAGGAMLCLGAGISAIRTQQVVTSVNQCYLRGDVAASLLAGSKALQWVYHDGVGYIFPAGGNITLKEAVQTGSWKSINTTGTDEAISKPVFSLWLNHGTAPDRDSYCYIVCPETSLERFKQQAEAPAFVVLKNDRDLQVVRHGRRYFMVLYRPGTVQLEDGLSITSDSKALVMIEEKDNGYLISLSDPTHQQEEINLSLSSKRKARAGGQGQGPVKILIKFPQGDDIGNTVSRFYKN